MVVSELLARSNISPDVIDQLVFGQVVQMPEAPNIAREIVLGTGMSIHTDAYSVSRACATSFQAIANVAESIMAGSISVGIAGGADSSSVLPIGVSKALARTLVDANKARTLSQRLKFDRRHGSVTAANSTPLTDGAAAVLMMSESRARELGLTPLGYLRSFAFSAIDVWEDMLLGPSYATPLALDRAGITLQDLTLIDMHEAFASQTLANLKMFASDEFAREKLGRDRAIGEVDMDKFNVLGGSIAYGHPFAATGARMITQTLNELRRRGGGLGLTTACAAGGLGAAMIVEVE